MASRGDINIEEIEPKLSSSWERLGFIESINNSGKFTKLKSKQFSEVGFYPVVDQGESLISGYVDDEELLYQGRVPIVIFGDHTRAIKYIDFEFAVGADGTKILDPIDIYDVKFFYYYLKSLNIPNFGYSRHFKILKAVNVPLPPLPEQKRIVAKLDGLFAHLEEVKGRLAKVPELLKQFRQSVLTQAVTGRLTEEWREGKELQTGLELLEKIKSIRQDEYILSCKNASKEGKRKPKAPILKIDLQSQLDMQVPNGWHICHIGDIGDVLNGSTPSRKESSYWNGDIPWVSSGLVQNNRISKTKEFITKSGFKNSSVSLLPVGTVLIAMIGEGKTRGQSAILEIEATTNQNIAAIKIDNQYVKSEFLQFWLIQRYEENRREGGGTGPKALNGQKVRELDFILAPIKEQTEIVRRVESLFAKADAIQAQYESLVQKIEDLTPTILAKAFRGELVEQLATDGDARELLEEIKRLKGERNPKSKKKK